MKKWYAARLTVFILVMVLFLSLMISGGVRGVFAMDKEAPDVNLYIHGEGSEGGPIFTGSGNTGDGPWYPGRTHSGTIRIHNNYSQSVKVNNLGLTMELERLAEGRDFEKVSDEGLLDTFAKNMELTIKRGRLLVFSETVFDGTFKDMLYKKDDPGHRGYDLPANKAFSIGKNDHVDLEYSVHMKEEAGNELQGLKATVNFSINCHEEQQYDPPEKKRKDTEAHWAHDCIETLLAHGIIQGYPDGTMRPENYITRAEAAVLIGKALGLEEKDKTFMGYIDFIPVWARGYIISTSDEGIFKGYPGRLFKPGKDITREEMVATLVRAFLPGQSADSIPGFDDWVEVSDWAREDVSVAVQNGVVEGYPDNTFRPKKNVTRAEAFTMVCKLLGYHETH